MPNIKPAPDFLYCYNILQNELAKGRKSGETEGWLTLEEIEERLELSYRQTSSAAGNG